MTEVQRLRAALQEITYSTDCNCESCDYVYKLALKTLGNKPTSDDSAVPHIMAAIERAEEQS